MLIGIFIPDKALLCWCRCRTDRTDETIRIIRSHTILCVSNYTLPFARNDGAASIAMIGLHQWGILRCTYLIIYSCFSCRSGIFESDWLLYLSDCNNERLYHLQMAESCRILLKTVQMDLISCCH